MYYRFDDKLIEQELSRAGSRINLGDLEELFLRLPVTLGIEGIRVIDEYQMPVFYLAQAVDEVLALPSESSMVLAFPRGGGLKLQREEAVLHVESLPEGMSAVTDFDEFSAAWRSFASDVRTLLIERVPDSIKDRGLRRWIESH
jgi:hypothetical protein